MSVLVQVTVGEGEYHTHATVELVACPHTGDYIQVEGVKIQCYEVTLTKSDVYVRGDRGRFFASQESADRFFRPRSEDLVKQIRDVS